MTKDLFSGVLTFALLIGGTVAIGSAMFGLDGQTKAATTEHGQVAVVTMPVVTITGHRDVAFARAESAVNAIE